MEAFRSAVLAAATLSALTLTVRMAWLRSSLAAVPTFLPKPWRMPLETRSAPAPVASLFSLRTTWG